jgi:hypothetical protein
MELSKVLWSFVGATAGQKVNVELAIWIAVSELGTSLFPLPPSSRGLDCYSKTTGIPEVCVWDF